jgi:23S rRNA-/tRNA-specific pseudouridylate synthase
VADVDRWILLDEGGLIAVNKPSGLPSTGRTLVDPHCLQSMLVDRARRMVWAVHQLDAETSGAILFVRRKALVAEVARRLRPPAGQKTYFAICHGEPAFVERLIDTPIGALARSRPRRAGGPADGRRAQTRVTVVARAAGYSLLELRLLTGRTHQARIHLAWIGCPLVGERLYRSPPCHLHSRHALHAARLVLGGPDGRLVIDAPVPDDLAELAGRLGLGDRRAFSLRPVVAREG